jgi:SAM-dependent methyltransferase
MQSFRLWLYMKSDDSVRGVEPEPVGQDSEATRIARVYRGYRVAGRAALYNPSNPGNRAIVKERLTLTQRLLERAGLADLSNQRVLDVGCGSGHELARMRQLGAKPTALVGVDLLPDRIEEARLAYPDIEFRVANAVQLEFSSESFGLLLSSTVFSSILDATTTKLVAMEMTRVLKPGGAIVWYDLRLGNPRNRNVRGVTANEVRALFPMLHTQIQSITLAPPVARRLGPMTPVTYPLLAALPFLRTHILGLLLKNGS